MRLSKNPVFRKTVFPWYRSRTMYVIWLLGLLLVLLFAITGIAVARQIPQYHGFIWVPVLLAAMSTLIILTTCVRLLRR